MFSSLHLNAHGQVFWTGWGADASIDLPLGCFKFADQNNRERRQTPRTLQSHMDRSCCSLPWPKPATRVHQGASMLPASTPPAMSPTSTSAPSAPLVPTVTVSSSTPTPTPTGQARTLGHTKHRHFRRRETHWLDLHLEPTSRNVRSTRFVSRSSPSLMTDVNFGSRKSLPMAMLVIIREPEQYFYFLTGDDAYANHTADYWRFFFNIPTRHFDSPLYYWPDNYHVQPPEADLPNLQLPLHKHPRQVSQHWLLNFRNASLPHQHREQVQRPTGELTNALTIEQITALTEGLQVLASSSHSETSWVAVYRIFCKLGSNMVSFFRKMTLLRQGVCV